MKIINTRDVHHKPTYLCIYGPSGIGKTSLAKTLPHGEVLLLDAESGVASLRGAAIDVISLAKDNEGAFVPEDKRIDRLKEFLDFIQTEECRKKYKYIVIDSVTEIGTNVLKTMQAKYTGFQAWGEYANFMIHFLKLLRDLNCYTTVCLALEGRIDDDQGNSFAYPELGGKKAKEFLLPAFDEVFRMVVDPERTRWLITQTTAKTQAKDRSATLDEKEKPDLGYILKKIRGESVV